MPLVQSSSSVPGAAACSPARKRRRSRGMTPNVNVMTYVCTRGHESRAVTYGAGALAGDGSAGRLRCSLCNRQGLGADCGGLRREDGEEWAVSSDTESEGGSSMLAASYVSMVSGLGADRVVAVVSLLCLP